jgi:hypothetical protein
MSSSSPKRSKFPNIPLSWVLILPFVVQIVGAVGLVGYFSYRSGQKAVEHLANDLMAEIGDRVNQHLDTYLGNAQKINQMNLEAVQAGVLDLNNFSALGKYFYRQKKSFDFTYPADIDYVPVDTVQNQIYSAGIGVSLPASSSGGYTYVPTHMTVSIELETQKLVYNNHYFRHFMFHSENFFLKSFHFY